MPHAAVIMRPLFSSRMSVNDLARLCRRLSTMLNAGIDVRTVIAREAHQARTAAARRRLTAISSAIAQGESLSAAFAATEDFFPPLLHEMLAVGEQTGHQGEIFGQLAGHYEDQIRLRRTFLATITWPMIQLAVALVVVAFLIWFSGLVSSMSGERQDLLGFGLTGNRGLVIYLCGLALVAVAIFVLIYSASRGLIWVRPVQRAVRRMPVLGPALQTLALARLAWSMQLTMHAGMEVRRALRLSLRSTHSAEYIGKIETIEKAIGRGESIVEAFDEAGGFPYEFVETIRVGEMSGSLAESMAHVSRQYRDNAQHALLMLTRVAGIAVWLLVAATIIVLIFRLFFFYIGMWNKVLQG